MVDNRHGTTDDSVVSDNKDIPLRCKECPAFASNRGRCYYYAAYLNKSGPVLPLDPCPKERKDIHDHYSKRRTIHPDHRDAQRKYKREWRKEFRGIIRRELAPDKE